METNVDVISYAGAIAPAGYTRLCRELAKLAKKSERALLVIGTPGGSPDAGFRIARALQHSYPMGFDALVPRYCKSAGTLTLLGARTLIMADESELGPLDIQVKKGDELYSRSSGLDITQAVDFLKAQALFSFNEYMHKFVQQGLSTKVASEIAVRLVQGILNPIAAQIEPLRVAEMQRATGITFSYGDRLALVGKNVQPDGLSTLVMGYPSHGFVIDRKEARDLFVKVHGPDASLRALCDDFQTKHGRKVNDSVPHVSIETKTLPVELDGEAHDEARTEAPNPPPRRAGKGQPAVNGSDGARAPGAKPRKRTATAGANR